MRTPDRAGFVTLNEMRLRVWDWGPIDGAPVIAVHGAFDHGRMFDELAPALADRGHRVVALDVRGHGASSRLPLHGHVWFGTILDIAGLARLLGDGRPVGLVGHSFGAGVCLGAAGAFGHLVEWVVTLDGLGPPPMAFDADVDVAAHARGGLDRAAKARGPQRVWPDAGQMADRRGANNPRMPRRWVEHLVEHGTQPAAEGPGLVWSADPMFNAGMPGAFSLEHLLAEYRLIEVPVLAVMGTATDTWRDLTDAEEDERATAIGAQIVRIADAGHYVHLEQPAAVLEAIGAFLDGRPTTAGTGRRFDDDRGPVAGRIEASPVLAGADDGLLVVPPPSRPDVAIDWRAALGEHDRPGVVVDLPGLGSQRLGGGVPDYSDGTWLGDLVLGGTETGVTAVGVGGGGAAAALLAASGRVARLVLVDGLGGADEGADIQIAAGYEWLARLDEASVERRALVPPPVGGDQRFRLALAAAVGVPTLVLSTPACQTPRAELDEILAGWAGDVTASTISDAEPASVLTAISAWASAGSGGV